MGQAVGSVDKMNSLCLNPKPEIIPLRMNDGLNMQWSRVEISCIGYIGERSMSFFSIPWVACLLAISSYVHLHMTYDNMT